MKTLDMFSECSTAGHPVDKRSSSWHVLWWLRYSIPYYWSSSPNDAGNPRIIVRPGSNWCNSYCTVALIRYGA